MNQHLNRFGLAYLKGFALLIAQMAASYVAAVNSITPAQWAAMDRLHKSGFFIGILGAGAVLIAAFLSQAIADARSTPIAAPLKVTTPLVSATAALLLGAFVLCGMSGCASGTIVAATTTYQVTSPTGQTTSIAFPKELTAKNLNLSIDPATGQIQLMADSFQSSSNQIIESAAAGQASALSTLSSIIAALVPAAVKAAGVATSTVPPPAPPAIPPVTTTLSAAPPLPELSQASIAIPKVALR